MVLVMRTICWRPLPHNAKNRGCNRRKHRGSLPSYLFCSHPRQRFVDNQRPGDLRLERRDLRSVEADNAGAGRHGFVRGWIFAPLGQCLALRGSVSGVLGGEATTSHRREESQNAKFKMQNREMASCDPCLRFSVLTFTFCILTFLSLREG